MVISSMLSPYCPAVEMTKDKREFVRQTCNIILTNRYEQEFEDAYDLFEVQRVLNNCFSYDLVPSPSVIQKALEACRRVNDYPTAVRTFEALKHKVENKEQYQAYLDELKETRQELGIDLKENLYSEA